MSGGTSSSKIFKGDITVDKECTMFTLEEGAVVIENRKSALLEAENV